MIDARRARGGMRSALAAIAWGACAIGAASAVTTAAGCLLVRDVDGLTRDLGDDGGATVEGGPLEGGSGGGGPEAAAPCPGSHGPAAVRVGGGESSYCIDSTEVTTGQYQAFVAATGDDTSAQAPECAWNTTFVPQYTSDDPSTPVTFVDHCDAVAYCAWAGKRLCGAIGGGAIGSTASHDDASRSQWYRACSRAGERTFPYGNDLDVARCNGQDNGFGKVWAAGSRNECSGAYDGVFDLSGNVREWEDACDSNVGDPAARACLQRGGAYYDVPGTLACSNYQTMRADARNPGVGFRCCSR